MSINGRQLAEDILNGLKLRVGELKERRIIPRMAVIRVGDDPAITSYINQKKKMADAIGAVVNEFQFTGNASEEEILNLLNKIQSEKNTHGIIVQLPLPAHLDEKRFIDAIKPEYDIDGFHAKTSFQVPVASAVEEILKTAWTQDAQSRSENFNDWLRTKKIIVLGKGKTAGRPIYNLLNKLGCDPIAVDTETLNRKKLIKAADVIISAVGKADVVNADGIKKNVILIGVGLHRGEDGKFHGDYDEEKIKDIARFYTPTPKGVGPVNVAKLMENLVTAAERQS